MIVQINTDHNIKGHERMQLYITAQLRKMLSHFEDKISRLEVHFGDENSNKIGFADKRCIIEARLEKRQPIAVTHHSDSIEKAFRGALDKIKKVLQTTSQKIQAH